MRYTLLLLAACGASSPPPPSSGTPVVVPDAASPPPPGCAATYAEIPQGAPCAGAEGTTCPFAEGSCVCGPQSYCGGAAPPEELLAELAKPVWQCKPARTDGCPEQPPTGACTTEGKVCGYGDCCHEAVTCTSGAWVSGGYMCPP